MPMLAVLLEWPIASAILRHVLGLVAGMLASKGYIDAEGGEALVGAILALVAVVWSIVEKRRRP